MMQHFYKLILNILELKCNRITEVILTYMPDESAHSISSERGP